ncbi:MAG TPA: hypothetical protein VKH19_03930 [Gemmatimonadaceae bacterium]|nr:hypothetical protein [Gemmatimonadaceae bacterium]
MANAIELTLLVGKGMALPVPRDVLDALTAVQVTSGKEQSGFQLSFAVGKSSKLVTRRLFEGFFEPVITRVIIVATVRGVPYVLMDGIVTRQEMSPSNDPGGSTLTITGEDLSVLMDLVEMPFMRFPAQPVAVRVIAILAKYLVFGIVPVPIPPIFPDIPNVLEKMPSQQGTDLQYIRSLASDCGYVFYVEPGPAIGSSIAYFGPDVRLPIPQPALSVNMDAYSNVDSLSFSLDGDQKKIVILSAFDPVTRKVPIPIPMPTINVLRPPLGLRPTVPRRVEFLKDVAKEEPPSVLNRALGVSLGSSDAITGSGSLNVLRYGHVLRSRMLVGVRGAGESFDGMYYVNSVSHSVRRGEFTQSFELSRDGYGSMTPMVPT